MKMSKILKNEQKTYYLKYQIKNGREHITRLTLLFEPKIEDIIKKLAKDWGVEFFDIKATEFGIE